LEKNTKGDATRRLFDTGPQDAGSPLPLIDAKRAQARADSQGSTVGRAPPRPPSGRPQSPDQDEGEDGPVRRRLAFNRIEADARSGLTPLELNTPIGGAPARRALVIGAAIVVFVGMNAALLGYLPFVEHRATPPLRGLELDTRRETAPATAAPPPAPGPAAPTPPALRPATPAPAPLSAPAPVQEARASVSPPRAEPGPSAPPPQPRPVPSPVLTARAAPSPAARPAPAPPTIARTPAAAPSAAAGPTAPSGLAVQVGAFKSAALAEEALAKAEAAAGAAPVALSHRQESVTKDGKTLVRALLVGFSTPQQAIRYCQTLQQSGGACFVRR
jgi:outer membrane biosynthesis protein TonB